MTARKWSATAIERWNCYAKWHKDAMCIGGDILANAKDRYMTIVDRRAPRVAIQITEIAVDAKRKTRRRQSVAHLTVTNLSGEEETGIIIRAIEKAGGR
jgi:hypothetical protein